MLMLWCEHVFSIMLKKLSGLRWLGKPEIIISLRKSLRWILKTLLVTACWSDCMTRRSSFSFLLLLSSALLISSEMRLGKDVFKATNSEVRAATFLDVLSISFNLTSWRPIISFNSLFCTQDMHSQFANRSFLFLVFLSNLQQAKWNFFRHPQQQTPVFSSVIFSRQMQHIPLLNSLASDIIYS